MKSFSLLVILCGLLFQTTGALAAPDGDDNRDSREKLVFVYADTYPPLSQGGGTKVSGLLPDLVHQIVEERMGYKVRHWGEAWPRAQLAVEKGTAFAFITSLNPERLAFAHASLEPVLTLPFRFFTMRGSAAAEAVKNGATISELKKYRFCKANADGWSKRYLATREIPYTQVNNYEVCLKMIERGRVDILVHSEKIINKLAETHNLKDKLVTHPQVVPESPAFHVLVSKKAAAGETFLQEFDEAFKRYHDDEGYAQLKSRYGY